MSPLVIIRSLYISVIDLSLKLKSMNTHRNALKLNVPTSAVGWWRLHAIVSHARPRTGARFPSLKFVSIIVSFYLRIYVDRHNDLLRNWLKFVSQISMGMGA